MKKNAKKKNERLMERELGGCQVLLKVFAQCLKSEDEDLEGSRIIQSQYPSIIRPFVLLQSGQTDSTLANATHFLILLSISVLTRVGQHFVSFAHMRFW